ncbi:hypothetical protein [Paraburkholderia sp. J67]|nr:hypothetical protein [Paraburkholderia sp. J67]
MNHNTFARQRLALIVPIHRGTRASGLCAPGQAPFGMPPVYRAAYRGGA